MVVLSLQPDVIILEDNYINVISSGSRLGSSIHSFKRSPEALPTSHRPDLSPILACSRIALVDDATPVPMHAHSSVHLPVRCEMLAEGRSMTPPPYAMIALIEQRIFDQIDSIFSGSPLMWSSLNISRRVATWISAGG